MFFLRKLAIISIVLLTSSCISTDSRNAGTFPIYGNYCGPLHPKKGETPMPIDMVDMSCKEHDACYDKKGYLNKMCDARMVESLKRITPQTSKEKIVRKALISYFKRSPNL